MIFCGKASNALSSESLRTNHLVSQSVVENHLQSFLTRNARQMHVLYSLFEFNLCWLHFWQNWCVLKTPGYRTSRERHKGGERERFCPGPLNRLLSSNYMHSSCGDWCHTAYKTNPFLSHMWDKHSELSH